MLLITVWDVFLFVYFLHYITQSFRYEQLIQRIFKLTNYSLLQQKEKGNPAYESNIEIEGDVILSPQSGYFQTFDKMRILDHCLKEDLVVCFLYPKGTYVLEGTPLLKVKGKYSKETLNNILLDVDFYFGQEIDRNIYYGFFHLGEVGVKRLAPELMTLALLLLP